MVGFLFLLDLRLKVVQIAKNVSKYTLAQPSKVYVWETFSRLHVLGESEGLKG